MKVLITGATGFVGIHLAEQLSHHEIHGSFFVPPDQQITQKFTGLHQLDVRDAEATHQLLKTIHPTAIIHLAAQTHIPTAFNDPWDTLETNVRGTLNILEAARQLGSSRILIISSAEVYGVIQPEDLPLRESQPVRPGNPYSVSKVTQELLGLQYHLSYQEDVMIVRPFNHIGPGQSERFALADFANQIARMEYGYVEPVLRVGNLAAERDFTDVRDIVRAYDLLLASGESGQIYNVCRGKPFALRDLVEQLISLSNVKVKIEVEKARLRPLDMPCAYGDASRLYQHTGWQPEIPMETTLLDILNYARMSAKR